MINGKITEKLPSNVKKIKTNSQEVLIELDDFEYFIPQPPQLPTTKDILKVIIEKINVINDKFDFIT